jgi:hypothetical protein
MAFIGWGLISIGMGLGLLGGIWLLIVAFKESIWWGLGSLFIPLVSLIFVVLHWSVAKTPFLISLVSVVMVIAGAFMTGMVSSTG